MVKSEVLEILNWVYGRLSSIIRINSFILFGSYARDEENSYSDINFIIISEDFPDKISSRYDCIRHILFEAKSLNSYKKLRRDGYYPSFSPILYKPSEISDTPPLFLDLVYDAIVIYDDGTFKKKINELRERLRALGAERRLSKKGFRYWLLKPDLKWGEVIEL